MGNYISTADIVDSGGLSDAQLNNIINFREKWVEKYCQDIYYPKTGYIHYFNGNTKNIIFFNFPFSIIEVTSLSKIDSTGITYETIEATSYRYNKFSIKLNTGYVFTKGYRRYKAILKVGHDTTDRDGNTDDFYYANCGLAEAIKMLVVFDINAFYGTTSGTSTASGKKLKSYQFYSENIDDYEYRRMLASKEPVLTSDTPTGIPFVDTILVTIRRRVPKMFMKHESFNEDIGQQTLGDVYAGRV